MEFCSPRHPGLLVAKSQAVRWWSLYISDLSRRFTITSLSPSLRSRRWRNSRVFFGLPALQLDELHQYREESRVQTQEESHVLASHRLTQRVKDFFSFTVWLEFEYLPTLYGDSPSVHTLEMQHRRTMQICIIGNFICEQINSFSFLLAVWVMWKHRLVGFSIERLDTC